VLLNVPVIVSDRNGRNIAGLKKEDFLVFQNGERQTVEFFADTEVPMNIAIIIDTSGSTTSVLGSIKKAAIQFLSTLRSEDRGMVLSFDDEVQVLARLSSDQAKLKNAVRGATAIKQGVWDAPRAKSNMEDVWDAPTNRGTMYDAIYQVVTEHFAEIKGRKAIILLTDSFELGYKVSLSELRNTLTESDTLIYPVIYQTYNLASFFPKNTKTVTLNDLLGLPIYSIIKNFAEITGGRVYAAEASDFQRAFQGIADDLKKQYVIGFYPTNAEGGKSASIKIDVARKDAVVRTKKTIRLKPPTPSKD
jgi:VWFA-related protein